MGLMDNIRKQIGSQFIEILEWLDDTTDTLVWRFPVYNQEIKMGAQLVVRENQVALFVNEGKAADLFTPGRYEIQTQNVPILTTLRGWKYGFESPFKAEVDFFNTRLFADLKWGTTNPVMMRDAEFGMIRLRAFGTYAMRIADAKKFFESVVGTRGLTNTDEITGQLRSIVLSRLSDAIAEAKVPALDLAAHYDELSSAGRTVLAPEFSSFGLELARFFIENISLPEEVEKAIDQRAKIGVFGDRFADIGKTYGVERVPGTPPAPLQYRLTRLPPLDDGPYYACRLRDGSTQCDCAEWTYQVADIPDALPCKHLAALAVLGWL